ncbi:MAG: hypothetical protein ACI8PQ_002201 [Planctomycetota bacterium]|jgi:hypothetical protein
MFLPSNLAALQDGEVYWEDEAYAPDALPEDFDASTREAVADWSAWSAEYGYRMTLTDDLRVLFLSEGKGIDKNNWKALRASLKAYDEFCPLLEGEPVPVGPATAPAQQGGNGQPEESRIKPKMQIKPTAVLIAIDDLSDYEAVLTHLGKLAPYLDQWLPEAKKKVGFSLERPLVAAWQMRPSGVEEWDPKNELVHRLGTLMIQRDHGRLPHWLLRGLAWMIEIEVTKGVYCFPDRSNFVWAAEHGSWPKLAKNLATKLVKDDKLIDVDTLAMFERDKWDNDLAVLSWSVAHWLAEEHADVMPQILFDLNRARVKGSTTYYPDGTWDTTGDFLLSSDRQQRIFARYLGEECETDWSEKISGTKKKKKKKKRNSRL